jgi:glycosyltransferase involved in cell wall biosynthesis
LTQDLEAIPFDLHRPRATIAALRRADVVHCHGIRAGLVGFVPTPAAVVQTPNGVHQARSKEGVVGAAARFATRAVLRRADLIVCVSESERTFVQSLAPDLAPRLHVVLNGVAPRPLAPASQRASLRTQLSLAPDQPTLLFVGGLRYQKNPQLVVEAVRLARLEVPQLVLLVAGGGPLQAEIERSAGPGVELLGERRDVAALLGAADAVVNTSRWEGLSLALLEALWAGRPLVVTDAPGNAEAVGDAGFVVPNHDPQAFANAIVGLFTEDGRLEHLSRRARDRAERLFGDKRMVEETLPLYDEARGTART